MRTENKYGRKFIIYNNLGDFFEEFKKYRAKKSNIASQGNYSEHVFPSLEWNKEHVEGKDFGRLFFLDLDYTEPKTEPFWSLGLDISPIKLKGAEVGIGSEWDKKERKILKILHKIWEKGSADTNSLDLNWPISNKKEGENPNPCSTKSFDKETKIIQWIAGGIIFVLSVSLLVYLFRKRKVKKN